MTKHTSRSMGLAAAIALMSLASAPVAVAASEHRDASDKAAEHQEIHPVPGAKGCLHHIAQYDEEGNFVGYKTERGPCR